MSLTVQQQGGGIVVVHGSERKKTVISPDVVARVRAAKEVLAKKGVDPSASTYADEVVRLVKQGIENDEKLKKQRRAKQKQGALLFELAIYGRAVLEMHPRELTHITLMFEPNDKDTYRAVCNGVGKNKNKLDKKLNATLAPTR